MSSQTQKFPFEFRSLNPEETALLKKHFGVSFEFARVGPKGYIISAEYASDAGNIYNMPVKSDDVVVCTFPRSGTTWTQELVWLITKDLDYKAASSTPLTGRYIFLEFPSIFTSKSVDKIIELNKSKGTEVDEGFLRQFTAPSSEILARCPSPRFIKTHLPVSFLPPTTLDTAKVVYVARDPRDVVVSFYHQNKLFTYLNLKADFETYWNLFKKDLILWTPFFEHLKEAWALRHHPNMLFLFYEELIKDLPAAVRRVADFLGKQYSEEQFAGLCDHLSFNNFKNNKSVNISELEGTNVMDPNESFIRKGKAGGWREYFDEEMTRQAERWMADNLRGTDLRFPHLDNNN